MRDHNDGGLRFLRHLTGRMANLGRAQRDRATLQAPTQEVITTSAIEGDAFNPEAVRSSIKARQTLVLNRALDGMQGKLTNAKWAAIGKCSADTALRNG